MLNETLFQTDEEIFNAIEKERVRQNEKIELIASENFVSKAVLEAMGSVFTNYSLKENKLLPVHLKDVVMDLLD